MDNHVKNNANTQIPISAKSKILYDRARALWAFIVSDHSWRLTVW